MIALAGSVFVAALLGSAHCAGMCGSFACLAADPSSSHGTKAARTGVVGTAAYSLGRLIAYALLGALAGVAGSGLDRAGALAGIARPAALVAGSLLVLWGVATLLALWGVRVPALAVPPALAARVAGVIRAVRERPPAVRGLVLGVSSAALPCGWLYAFVVTASAAGSALLGAAVMTAFWAGTLPVMTLVALGAQRALGPVRRRLPVLTATAMIVLGLLTVAGRVRGAHAAVESPSPSAGAAHGHAQR
jgi:sulfite exporter TauE/SafE